MTNDKITEHDIESLRTPETSVDVSEWFDEPLSETFVTFTDEEIKALKERTSND